MAENLFFQDLKANFLKQHKPYEKGASLELRSTGEITEMFHNHYPSEEINPITVADFLRESGFTYQLTTDRYMWMLGKY